MSALVMVDASHLTKKASLAVKPIKAPRVKRPVMKVLVDDLVAAHVVSLLGAVATPPSVLKDYGFKMWDAQQAAAAPPLPPPAVVPP